MDLLDRVQSAPLRAVTIGTGFKVRLEDRLKYQLGCGLYRSIPDSGNTVRPFAVAPGLRYHYPSHRGWPIRLLNQVLPDAVQPFLEPVRFDLLETHPVNTWCAIVRAHQVIRVSQDVLAIDLVVEQVEAEVRLRLRLEIQLPLKVPDLIGCLQAHRQSPILLSVQSTPEVRALSSAGVTRPLRSYDPVRLPCRPAPESAVEAATLARHGPPPITRLTFPACRAHYPDGPEQVRLSVASLSYTGLPRISGGSASMTSLSRPAQALLALRPTGFLNRPWRPLSRGFNSVSYPTEPLVSYQVLPTTSWVDPSSTGEPRRWGALRKGG